MRLLLRAWSAEVHRGSEDYRISSPLPEPPPQDTTPVPAEAEAAPEPGPEAKPEAPKPRPPALEPPKPEPVPRSELQEDALSAVAAHYSAAEFRWLRECEAFVATVVALLITRHVRQFQHFMYTLTGSAFLLLLAVSSYPFEPHRLLLTFIWIVVGSVALIGIVVYIELDRNALISRLAGTAAGHMTLDAAFAIRIVAWVIVPLLSVAAAQYPDLANALFTAVEPFARALR
jgi:hypothetical protein